MELYEFIQSSLVQIMKGVQKASAEWSAEPAGSGGIAGNGVISPAWGGPKDFAKRVQEVKFDIAVTATTKTEGGGGGGIKVVGIELSGKGSRSAEDSSVSRISFSIPILPFMTTVIQPQMDRR